MSESLYLQNNCNHGKEILREGDMIYIAVFDSNNAVSHNYAVIPEVDQKEKFLRIELIALRIIMSSWTYYTRSVMMKFFNFERMFCGRNEDL